MVNSHVSGEVTRKPRTAFFFRRFRMRYVKLRVFKNKLLDPRQHFSAPPNRALGPRRADRRLMCCTLRVLQVTSKAEPL